MIRCEHHGRTRRRTTMFESRPRWCLAAAVIAVGVLCAAPLAGQQTRPYTIDELVDLLEAGVPTQLIIERAGVNCLSFELDDTTQAALERVGASAEFVDALRGACVRDADSVGTLPSGQPANPEDDPSQGEALPESIRDRIRASLVRISYLEGGRMVCTNGFVAGRDGLVLTALGALPESGRFRVTDADGQDVFGEASIAATDARRNIAVLRFAEGAGQPIAPAASPVDGDQVWSIYSRSCAGTTTASATLAGWPDLPTGPAFLDPALANSAVGAPLVDANGGLVGIATAPDTVLPSTLANALVERARAVVLAEAQVDGGGFPWVWVGAGDVAAVAGAVLASRGGQGSPSTGSITIPLP